MKKSGQSAIRWSSWAGFLTHRCRTSGARCSQPAGARTTVRRNPSVDAARRDHELRRCREVTVEARAGSNVVISAGHDLGVSPRGIRPHASGSDVGKSPSTCEFASHCVGDLLDVSTKRSTRNMPDRVRGRAGFLRRPALRVVGPSTSSPFSTPDGEGVGGELHVTEVLVSSSITWTTIEPSDSSPPSRNCRPVRSAWTLPSSMAARSSATCARVDSTIACRSATVAEVEDSGLDREKWAGRGRRDRSRTQLPRDSARPAPRPRSSVATGRFRWLELLLRRSAKPPPPRDRGAGRSPACHRGGRPHPASGRIRGACTARPCPARAPSPQCVTARIRPK